MSSYQPLIIAFFTALILGMVLGLTIILVINRRLKDLEIRIPPPVVHQIVSKQPEKDGEDDYNDLPFYG